MYFLFLESQESKLTQPLQHRHISMLYMPYEWFVIVDYTNQIAAFPNIILLNVNLQFQYLHPSSQSKMIFWKCLRWWYNPYTTGQLWTMHPILYRDSRLLAKDALSVCGILLVRLVYRRWTHRHTLCPVVPICTYNHVNKAFNMYVCSI
jgi:hypothetical protein